MHFTWLQMNPKLVIDKIDYYILSMLFQKIPYGACSIFYVMSLLILEICPSKNL